MYVVSGRPQDPSAGVEASVSAETNMAVYNSSAPDLLITRIVLQQEERITDEQSSDT